MYLIEILHQTTTRARTIILANRCILSKFYIKPQPYDEVLGQLNVVSYRNSTSNHNPSAPYTVGTSLYLIEILHQTTTGLVSMKKDLALYLIEILHQTTTLPLTLPLSLSCILSKFYIKPQLSRRRSYPR